MGCSLIFAHELYDFMHEYANRYASIKVLMVMKTFQGIVKL